MELLTNAEAAEKHAQATFIGWAVLIAALGMTLGLLGNEISGLQSWDQTMTPAFVGKAFIHLSVVAGAWVGGKLMPSRP